MSNSGAAVRYLGSGEGKGEKGKRRRERARKEDSGGDKFAFRDVLYMAIYTVVHKKVTISTFSKVITYILQIR